MGLITKEIKFAVQSLDETGKLPDNIFWNHLRIEYQERPKEFTEHHRIFGALLRRDLLQREESLTEYSPLFPSTHYFEKGERHYQINAKRFEYYHPTWEPFLTVHLPIQPIPTACPEPTSSILFGLGLILFLIFKILR